MTDYREWFKSVTGQRVTADEIAQILGVSRATVTRRLTEGLDASDVIQVSRALRANPVMALVDLDHLTHAEALGFLEEGGKLLETAEPGELALELARQLNPATKSPEINEIAERRKKRNPPVSTPSGHDGTVTDWDDSQPFAADSSPDEGGTPDDYIP